MQPHGPRWTALTGRVERRERPIEVGSTRSRPRWHRRGAFVAATRAGERKTKAPAANGRWAAAVSPGRRATTRGDGVYTGMTRENERERANGLDSPEGARRRRIAAAATGGEERGKRRRGHEGPIPGGESIYAATGIHPLRRIRRSYAQRGRRREALSSSGGDGGEHTASGGSSRGGAS
ncbi:Epstein-Barr virus EBNA-1-like [Oryza sativa Japonica Group]|uniref:Epstein-Barr virus EBNA-1-like n=1 Tax=Oryza sativa subsp. japonica TaxID=39947 RepID=Q8S1A2_ORYSJ|nr:Epstein-Barr virus EBNA-1-like [Oryza sativa Japonica Group]BAB93337.1 Epstein-Barr virus EBNA-1-like [Oryza sativa Japonica Group]